MLDSVVARVRRHPPGGDVAQLGEHRVRIAGVRGSSPLISTITALPHRRSAAIPGARAEQWVGWAGGEPKGL